MIPEVPNKSIPSPVDGEPIWTREQSTFDLSSPAATSTPTLSFINGKQEVSIEPASDAEKEARGDVFESVSSTVQNLTETEEKVETSSIPVYTIDLYSIFEPEHVYDQEPIIVESTPPSSLVFDLEDETLILPGTPSDITDQRSFSPKPYQPSFFPTKATISDVAPSKPIETIDFLTTEDGSGQKMTTIQAGQVTQKSTTLQATEGDNLDHTMDASEKKPLLPSHTDITDITSNYWKTESGMKEYASTTETPMSATLQTDSMSTSDTIQKEAVSQSTIMITSSPDMEISTTIKSLFIAEEEGSGDETRDFIFTKPTLQGTVTLSPTRETLVIQTEETILSKPSEVNIPDSSEKIFSTQEEEHLDEVTAASTVEKTSTDVPSATYSETFPFSEADGSGDQLPVISTTKFSTAFSPHTTTHSEQSITTTAVYTVQGDDEKESVKAISEEMEASQASVSSSYVTVETTEPVQLSNISEVIQEPFTATIQGVISEEVSGDQRPDSPAGEIIATTVPSKLSEVPVTDASEMVFSTESLEKETTDKLTVESISQGLPSTKSESLLLFPDTEGSGNQIIDAFTTTTTSPDRDHLMSMIPVWDGTLLPHSEDTLLEKTSESPAIAFSITNTVPSTHEVTSEQESTTMITSPISTLIPAFSLSDGTTVQVDTDHTKEAETKKPSSTIISDDITSILLHSAPEDDFSGDNILDQLSTTSFMPIHTTVTDDQDITTRQMIQSETKESISTTTARTFTVDHTQSIAIEPSSTKMQTTPETTDTSGTSHFKTESHLDNGYVETSNTFLKESLITSDPTKEILQSEGSGEESGEFEDGSSGDFSNTIVESTPPSQAPSTKYILTTKSEAVMGTDLPVHPTFMEVSSDFAHTAGAILAFTEGSGDQTEDILNTVTLPTSSSTTHISPLESIPNATHLTSTAIDMERDQNTSKLEGSADSMPETTEPSEEYSVRTDEAEISYTKSTLDYSNVETTTLPTELTSESSSQIPSQTEIMSSSLESGSGDTEDTAAEIEGADDDSSGDLVSSLVESFPPSVTPTMEQVMTTSFAGIESEGTVGYQEPEKTTTEVNTEFSVKTDEAETSEHKTTLDHLSFDTSTQYVLFKSESTSAMPSTIQKETTAVSSDAGSGDMEDTTSEGTEDEGTEGDSSGALIESAAPSQATSTDITTEKSKESIYNDIKDIPGVVPASSFTDSAALINEDSLVKQSTVTTVPMMPGTDSNYLHVDIDSDTDTATTPVFSVIYQHSTDKEVTTVVPSSSEIRSSKITTRLHDTKSITSPVIIFTEELKDEDELFSTVTDSMKDHSTKTQFITKDDMIIDADTISGLEPSSPFDSTINTEEAAGITAVTMTPQSSNILTEEPEGSGTESSVLPSSDTHLPTQSTLEGPTVKRIDVSHSIKAEETETKPTLSVDIRDERFTAQTVAPSKMDTPHLSTSTDSTQTTRHSTHSTTHYSTGKSYPSQTTLQITTNHPTITNTDSVFVTSQHSHIITKPSHVTTTQPKTILPVTSTQAMPKTPHFVFTDNFSGDSVMVEGSGMQTSIPDVTTFTDTTTTLTADTDSALYGTGSATSGYNTDKTTDSKQSEFNLVTKESGAEEGSGLISELTISSGSDIIESTTAVVSTVVTYDMTQSAVYSDPRSALPYDDEPVTGRTSSVMEGSGIESDTVQPTTKYEVPEIMQSVEETDKTTTDTELKSTEMSLFDSIRENTSSPLLSEAEETTAIPIQMSTDHSDFSTTHSDALVSLFKETESTTYTSPVLTTSRFHSEGLFETTLRTQTTEHTSTEEDLSTAATIIPKDSDENTVIKFDLNKFYSETSVPESETPLGSTPVYESKTSVDSTVSSSISDKNPLERLFTVSPKEHFSHEEVTTVIPSSDETSPASPVLQSFDSVSEDKLSEEQETIGKIEEPVSAVLESTDYTTSSADGVQIHPVTTASPSDISDDAVLVEGSAPDPETLNGTQRPTLNEDLGHTVVGETYDISGVIF